jgi:putative protein-disulfide isomerase
VPLSNTPLPAASETETARIEAEYYTDPLCCWSWAFEPHLERLDAEFGDRLVWRYRMGGMVADWAHYNDPLNDVTRPIQMGPVWIQVRCITGLPLDERVWFEDPPGSSYPACLAFKAAEAQSQEAAERYLQRMRTAFMTERRNIARPEVLQALAEEIAEEYPRLLDAARFAEDLNSPETAAAFREDIKQARYLGLGRFPALTLRRAGAPGIILVGYRPYEALERALRPLLVS